MNSKKYKLNEILKVEILNNKNVDIFEGPTLFNGNGKKKF